MLPQPATGRQPAFLAALLDAIVSARRPSHSALVLAGVARGVRLGVEGGKDVERGVPVVAAAVAEVVPTPASRLRGARRRRPGGVGASVLGFALK